MKDDKGFSSNSLKFVLSKYYTDLFILSGLLLNYADADVLYQTTV